MAHSNSAKKRIRQNITRRAINRWRIRAMREALKDFSEKVATGSNEDATQSFRAASAIIDRTAQKGVIHRNQAARRKSRLNQALKAKVTA
ncbi:MAG: 30S ribosomal protein S20 [Phycisphaerales bacterium]